MIVKQIGEIRTKKEIEEFFSKSELPHISITYCGCNGFFVPISDSDNRCTYLGISVTLCNKDICRVHPHEILYIAIEDRKSVLYLTDRKIETHYSMEHWKGVLDEKTFVQPHYSYLVNLNYVEGITKNFVILRCGGKEYKVYTSIRKLATFKKAVLEFGK